MSDEVETPTGYNFAKWFSADISATGFWVDLCESRGVRIGGVDRNVFGGIVIVTGLGVMCLGIKLMVHRSITTLLQVITECR